MASSYETGDKPGPDDPTETTDENTPIKIGDTIFLCTPHSKVITIGFKHWEHMTCRGVTHYEARCMARRQQPLPLPHPPPRARLHRPCPDATAASDTQVASDTQASAPAEAAAAASVPEPAPSVPADRRCASHCAERGNRQAMPELREGRRDRSAPHPNMGQFTPGGYYSTSPPAVAGHLVIIGGHVTNESNNEPSGFIRAFDVDDGHLVWNWDPGNPDHTEPIAAGGTYVRNSPNMWSMFRVDEKRGLIYLPMGNQTPDQWGGQRTPQAERFGVGVVALDAATGKLRWNYQFTHHNLWDMGGQPTFVDLQTATGMQPALIASTKQGSIYVLNRETVPVAAGHLGIPCQAPPWWGYNGGCGPCAPARSRGCARTARFATARRCRFRCRSACRASAERSTAGGVAFLTGTLDQ